MHPTPFPVRARRLSVYLLALLATACGGSGGGGGGQAPDPVVLELPIAYIGRPLNVIVDDQPQAYAAPDILDPIAFNPGARLYLKPRATATATARAITDPAFGADALYDVRDLSTHPHGDRLLFSLRAPEIPNANDDDQPTWNIWEYDLRTDTLRRVINSSIVAEIGQDLSPRYLGDDRILFSSTRQTRSRAVLLDDGKPQYSALEESRQEPAFNLHVMDDDGTNIQQITFNQSHDLQPTVLDDGRVLFTRWDRFGRNNLSLYTVNPDGTNLQFHYGYHSLNGTGVPTLFRPSQLPDGRILALMKPRNSLYGGVMVAVDTEHFTEENVAIAGASGTAMQPLLSLPVNIDGEPSVHGLYGQVHPLNDGSRRLLVSWSQCRLQEPGTERIVPCTDAWLQTPGIQEAPPLFGIWIYHLDSETQQPVVVPEENRLYTEVVSFEPRNRPCAYPAAGCTAPNRVEGLTGTGVLHIRSVYDRDGTESQDIARLSDPLQTPTNERPARFLRLIKAVSIPDNNTLNLPGSSFGVGGQGMREILGYAPVEPDGSAMVQVPADVAFTFEIVDAQGKRINGFPRHQNWLQLRAGEQRNCQGCHTASSTVPHGRLDAEPFPAYSGALGSFANTLRLDRFNTPELPELGETMAEFDARIRFTCNPLDPNDCTFPGTRTPMIDLLYEDHWTDPAVTTPAAASALRYADLTLDDYRQVTAPEDPLEPLVVTETELLAPASEDCQLNWHSLCRVAINYEWHIHPLWERPRYLTEEVAGERVPVTDDEGNLVNHTCTGCHSRLDADGMPQLPAASLELIAANTGQGRMTSYQHLLAGRPQLTLEDDSVIPLLVESGEFECDLSGLPPGEPEPELGDENCVEIPIMVQAPLLASPMSAAGAIASQARFFNRFAAGGGSHAGYLNPSELRLITEWLDLGVQYYNNPFDAVDED